MEDHAEEPLGLSTVPVEAFDQAVAVDMDTSIHLQGIEALEGQQRAVASA